jgi:fructoselysine-6-P-deglycase FrlB-like protein
MLAGMNGPAFDPTAALPAPPSPWAGSDTPTARAGPPYHMTDMIAAEPHLARRLLGRLSEAGSAAAGLAAAIREAVDAGRPIVVTGCGTSEHAALGTVEILREALAAGRHDALSEQALELALAPPAAALVIGVSHEGGTTATNRALEASRAAGSRTALITAADGSPGAALADIVVATGEMDQSWCHTVGYTSPLLVAAAVAGHLAGAPVDAERVATVMTRSAADGHAAEGIAGQLAQAGRLLVIGSGADRVAGRELVLKVEEASWLPSAYRDLETFLHGHLPATDDRTGLVLVLTDRAARAERVDRARQALAAAAVLGHRSAAILAAGTDALIPAELTPAGRLVVPDDEELPAAVASLLASAMALQLLTERIARARGTNPDPIRRDDDRYRRASAAADG